MKKFWKYLKVLTGLGLITYLFVKVDIGFLVTRICQGNLLWLALAVLCILFPLLVIQPVRLHLLLKNADISLGNVFIAVNIGMFFNNILPTNVGGDIIKSVILKRVGSKKWGELVSIVFIERVSGMLILFLALCTYLIIYNQIFKEAFRFGSISMGEYDIIILIAVIIIGTFVVWRVFRSQVVVFMDEFKNQLKSLTPNDYLVASGLSIIFHLFRMLSLFFLVLFFSEHIAITDLIFVLSFTALASLIPLSIGALGIREGAIVWSMGLFGVLPEAAFGAAIFARILFILVSLLGGYYYVRGQLGRSIENT